MREAKSIELEKGRSLHCVTDGSGPDVVLLHGALATSHDWISGPFDAIEAEGCRVMAIDRPGRGLSRRPRFEGTPRDQARQIKQAFDALGIGRPLLVGHSFGGLVSLAFAELFPESVAGLVLVAPVAFPEPRPLEHSFLAPRSVPFLGPFASVLAGATIDPPVLKMIQRQMFSPEPVPEHWERSFPYDQLLDPAAMVFEGEDMAATLPLSPAGIIDLGRIRAPTWILAGAADQIVRPELQAKPLARLLPQTKLQEVEGVGHMLHHARPELVVSAIREALAAAG